MSFRFPSTRWTLIRAHRESAKLSPEEWKHVADDLCRTYWKPAYSFLRASGHDHQDAEDLTQGFFATSIHSSFFEKADPEKGRLRNYLLKALRHFAENERRKAAAIKRGGGLHFVPLDAPADGQEAGASTESASNTLSPDLAFDRKWAECLLESTLAGMRLEYESAGKSGQFEILRPFLDGGGDSLSAAAALQLAEGAFRVLVHRFRKRYRERIQAEIRQTLTSEADVAEELNHLLTIMGGQKA